VVFLIIFVVSYWVAFVSGASKFIIQNNKKKKPRGTITGDEDKSTSSFIKRVSPLLKIIIKFPSIFSLML